MAIDFNAPTTATNYLSVLSQIIENLDAIMTHAVKSGSNIPTNSVIIDPTSREFEKYNGSTWDAYDVKANAKEFLGVPLDDTGISVNWFYQYDGTDFVIRSIHNCIGNAVGSLAANDLLQWNGSALTAKSFDELWPTTLSTWTPSWSYDGTSISGFSYTNNHYIQFGGFCWYVLSASFTLVGDGQNIQYSLPVAAERAFPVVCYGGIISSTSRTLLGGGSGSSAFARPYDASNWTAGTRSFTGLGFYQTA